MQCACTVLLSVACLALPYFSTISHRWNDFEKKVIEHKMCVLFFSTSSVWNIPLYKKEFGEVLSYMCIGHQMVLRRIFGTRRDKVTGEWRRLHNEELNDLYSSPNIVRVIKSRRMRWAGHVARVGEERKVYRVLVGKPEGRRPLRRPRHR